MSGPPVPPVATGVVGRLTRLLDAGLDTAVASFALWTVVHALALVGLPLGTALAVWGLGTVLVAWWRARGPWLASGAEPARGPALVALAVSAGGAALSTVLVRPDLDDAFYMARATWTADHGAVPTSDFLFGDGSWPAVYYVDPDFSALDSLQGGIAWASGTAAGSVAYRWFVPLATFAAVWALWRLLRAWQVRRPATGLVLALVMLLWGGYAHASFGNLFLGRIWQGKVVFVSLLVPCLWTVFASLWARTDDPSDRRQVRSALVVLAVCGTAAVGLSQTAVFVVPLAAVAAAVPLVVRRRFRLAGVLVASASVVPVASGLAVFFSPGGGESGWQRDITTPWTMVVASLPVGAVVLAAGLVVLVGGRWPKVAVLTAADQQRALALAVVVAALFTLPPLFGLVEVVVGGDAIGWRVAWVLPVPALVGLLASLPPPRQATGVPALTAIVPTVAAATVLVVAGLPLWSPTNAARFGPVGAWKVEPVDLEVARWIVAQRPGTFLAGNRLAAATSVVSSEPRPVGNRLDYMESLHQVDGARAEQRIVLQEFADGPHGRSREALPAAGQALDDLDVSLACVAWDDDLTQELFETAGFTSAVTVGPWGCWVRE
ncbi:MAG: DUF6077 domain-containing protein [Micrococcales bacterium]|nr:DUF6077 domain-containing protein [Micrococcales bacterium]